MVSGKPYFPARQGDESAETEPVAGLPLKVKDETVGAFLVESLADGDNRIAIDSHGFGGQVAGLGQDTTVII